MLFKKYVIVLVILFNYLNVYSQKVLHEVQIIDSSIIYNYYQISLQNNTDSILIFEVDPSYQFNITDYEEVKPYSIDSINKKNIFYLYCEDNIIGVREIYVMPKQTIMFKMKVQRKLMEWDNVLQLYHKFSLNLCVNLAKNKNAIKSSSVAKSSLYSIKFGNILD